MIPSPDEGAEAQRGCASFLQPHSQRVEQLLCEAPSLCLPRQRQGTPVPRVLCACVHRTSSHGVSPSVFLHNLGEQEAL